MADQTNPKDLLGVKKVPMNLLPAAGRIEGARGMAHGAAKYGPYNWREKKIKMSIYLDAIERHLVALYDGEDTADDSGVSHLGHIIAGASILCDAKEGGNLIDDRPAKGPAPRLLARYDESKRPEKSENPPVDLGVGGIISPEGRVGFHPDGTKRYPTYRVCPEPKNCALCSSFGYK